MENQQILVIVILMALVTLVPRVFPVLVLNQKNLPKKVNDWLEMVPVCIATALCTCTLSDKGTSALSWMESAVILLVVYVAYKSRSICIALFSAMFYLGLVRNVGLVF